MDRICCDCGAHFDGYSRDVRCPDCRKIDRVHPLRERICNQCNEPYTTRGPRSYYCPDCAKERRRAADIRCRENKNRRSLGSEDLCKKCGGTYIVTGGLQRFCPQCAADEARKRARDNYYKSGKARREERTNNRIIATGTCIICGKPFPLDGSRFVVCSEKCAKANWDNLIRRWAKENPERIKARMHLWELEHKEQRKEYRRKYYKQKKEQK